jgi:hypothetical protein
MPGSIFAQLLPGGERFDPEAFGSPAPDGLAPGSPAGSAPGSGIAREPRAETPLLRGDGGALVGYGATLGHRPGPDADPDRVQAIVSQLLPIQSRASLMSSFEREANPNDEFVRRAYECVWAELVVGVARTGTRRARIRATMAQARGGTLRGRG